VGNHQLHSTGQEAQLLPRDHATPRYCQVKLYQVLHKYMVVIIFSVHGPHWHLERRRAIFSVWLATDIWTAVSVGAGSNTEQGS